MAKKGSVLVVDDEEIMRDVLETLLSAEGYRVDLAKTGEEGLDAYTKRAYDVVLLDVSMPGIGGLRALEEFLKIDAEAVVLMITAYATFDTAIAAWEKGAFGCIRKPFQNEHITAQVAAGIKRRRKEEERRTLRQAMSREVDRGAIIGRSDLMQEVFRLVEQVAPARSTVLITGESGTGKELIAKAIHEASPRASRSFVTVNSSNIPSELLESELFGHTRGAFTGAVAAKKGLFEVADGGSIFLDEIGDMPPLRDRNEDILPLAQHFIQKYNEENERNVSEQLAPDVLALLEGYSWPGNVRERENTIERAVVIAPGDEITKECLRPEISDPKSVTFGHHDGASNAAVGDIGRGINFYEEVRRFEIDLIRRALEQTGGHQSRAARLLSMNATTLNSKIKTYNINLRP